MYLLVIASCTPLMPAVAVVFKRRLVSNFGSRDSLSPIRALMVQLSAYTRIQNVRDVFQGLPSTHVYANDNNKLSSAQGIFLLRGASIKFHLY